MELQARQMFLRRRVALISGKLIKAGRLGLDCFTPLPYSYMRAKLNCAAASP
jgi:hypothetical protein